MPRLPSPITSRLAQFERRRRLALLSRGAGEAVMVMGLGLLLAGVLEWTFKSRVFWRVWLSGANYAAAAAWLAWRAGGPFLRPWSWRRIARQFEVSAGGQFHERILSAVEMAGPQPPGVSSWMVERTIALASKEVGVVDPAALVDGAPAKRAWKGAAGLWLGLGLACLLPGVAPRAWLALYPYASTVSLANIKLVVTPGDCRLRQGQPLEIKVTADTALDQPRLLLSWEDGFQESVLMTAGPSNSFVVSLPAVSQGFRYLARAGEAESPVFTVKLEVPPRIAGMRWLIEPPAYTQWTNREAEGGSADFLEGSRLRLTVETRDEPVAQAEWLAEGCPPQSLKVEGDRLSLELRPTNTVRYQLRLRGANQLEAEPGEKWVLQLVKDEPPVARIVAAGADSGMVQRDEVLALAAQASDDVGLKRVDLVVLNHDAQADARTLFALKAGAPREGVAPEREMSATLNYDLGRLSLSTGDEAQFVVVATDVREQTTRSEPVSVTIGSWEKAVEARMAARLKQLVSAMDSELAYLEQTRSSWLSIGRNYTEDDPVAQGPALVLLESRLGEFGAELDRIGNQLVAESETNNVSDARFLYRLGTTLAAWGAQQREVLLANCARVKRSAGTGLFQVFDQGRELFSLALTDLEDYRRALAVLEGAFETDVLATRCEGAQGRYQRGLPVLRGATNGLAAQSGGGLPAAFFQGVKGSLALPASVPPALAQVTNAARSEVLGRLVREKYPLAERLSTNLTGFAAWKEPDSEVAERQADELTGLSKEARRILREEVEKYRWRFEGSAGLKRVENGLRELREINQALRQQPYNPTRKRTEQEQAKITLAKAWERQLEEAAAQAARQFFEVAKQKDATLAERVIALKAAAQAREELEPAAGRLRHTLEETYSKEEMASQVDARLNTLWERFRELNEEQERINREQVAARARLAFPAARAFARAQQGRDTAALSARYDKMEEAVATVLKAQRVAGDYHGAVRLESLAGKTAPTARGRETANELRELAMRTDPNPPSLAQAIPPPMQAQTQALEKRKVTALESANELSRPRLAMTLEALRLFRQADPKTAVAYDFLGEDLGALLESPARLSSATLGPLAERAATLAGQKGEEARQAEVRAANERLRQLAAKLPNDQEALAARLDELSALAKEAAPQEPKRAPLTSQLDEVSKIAPPDPDWADSTNPKEIAAGAAQESLDGIRAAPRRPQPYTQASEVLADAARQLRMDAALGDVAPLNPYPGPQLAASQDPPDPSEPNSTAHNAVKMDGPAGKAVSGPAPKGMDQGEWARLNERLRQAIHGSGIEHFTAEQQAAIRAYFQRLSSGDQPSKRD